MTWRSALQVNRTVNPPYRSNTYLLTRSGHPNRLMVDHGKGVDSRFTGQIKTSGVSMAFTHEHYDQISGLPALKKYRNGRMICLFAAPPTPERRPRQTPQPMTLIFFYRQEVVIQL